MRALAVVVAISNCALWTLPLLAYMSADRLAKTHVACTLEVHSDLCDMVENLLKSLIKLLLLLFPPLNEVKRHDL